MNLTLDDSNIIDRLRRTTSEERATLTRFDTELRELDKVKKQAATDLDVEIKKLEHEM